MSDHRTKDLDEAWRDAHSATADAEKVAHVVGAFHKKLLEYDLPEETARQTTLLYTRRLLYGNKPIPL